MSAFTNILRKDLRLELRAGETTVTLIFVSLLILIVLTFALDAPGKSASIGAGALWVAMIFSGIMGAARVLIGEWENGCIRGLLLSPIERTSIYCAKLFAAFVFMALAELAAIFLMVRVLCERVLH